MLFKEYLNTFFSPSPLLRTIDPPSRCDVHTFPPHSGTPTNFYPPCSLQQQLLLMCLYFQSHSHLLLSAPASHVLVCVHVSGGCAHLPGLPIFSSLFHQTHSLKVRQQQSHKNWVRKRMRIRLHLHLWKKKAKSQPVGTLIQWFCLENWAMADVNLHGGRKVHLMLNKHIRKWVKWKEKHSTFKMLYG